MKISILGCGRWGTFLAWYANSLKHDVLLWGRKNSRNLEELRLNRENEYLSLDNGVVLSDSLEGALKYSEYIIISVSSQHLGDLCRKINRYNVDNKTIILAMKGIERKTGLRLTQVVNKEIKQNHNVAIWVGPGHVQSFTRGIPNCMLISSLNIEVCRNIIKLFNSELIRLYIGKDLIGNEIGAAAKNVIGIAAGMLDGVGYSSLKGSVIARGAREVSRLVKAMGGNEITVYGLSHIGDYEATLFSQYSNNRLFGEQFIKHEGFEKLAEGVATVESLMLLSKEYDVEMPISEAVYSIVKENGNPHEILEALFLRDIKYEF